MRPNQLSQTAAFIAIKFYGLTRTEPYRSWFSKDTIAFYESMVQALPSPLNWYYSGLHKKWIRTFFTVSEELLLPGDLMHILMRKYYIGEKTNQLLGADYNQLLVLGAGFDHLAATHSGRGIPSFELDAPRMVSFKRRFLKKNGLDNRNIHIANNFVPRREMRTTLHQIESLKTDRNTVVVAEGFFDYLEYSQTRKILEDLTSFFKNKVTLISTIFALDELSSLRRLVFKTGVRLVGEKIRLNLSKHEFLSLLTQTGFSGTEVLSSRDMEQQMLKPENITMPVLEGFYLTFSKY